MDQNGVTDISREFLDLFDKESFVCFFSFQVSVPEKTPLSGLCKVARPKRGTSKLNYLSLMFIIDAPDNDARTAVETILRRLEGDSLKEDLSELKTLVSIPGMEFDAGIYLKQVDLILHAQYAPDEHFIAERIYPSILKAARFEAGEMIWWEDLAELRASTPARAIVQKTPDVSFGEKLKRIFGVKHD